jgi:cellulose synthase/poly-beta-1,6-N-acetylglucosamine synthase-like glycosyltransferase
MLQFLADKSIMTNLAGETIDTRCVDGIYIYIYTYICYVYIYIHIYVMYGLGTLSFFTIKRKANNIH